MASPDETPNLSQHPIPPKLFAGSLFLLLIISFPDVFFGWGSFFTRDFANFGHPLATFVSDCYRAGEVPLWNPYNYAGIPFLAQWNTLALYPFSLIYILLPLPWSLNLFNLAHLFLAGFGMYCFARRWLSDSRAAAVAGCAYMFNGLLLTALMWPNNIAALAWLPLVLLAGQRAIIDRTSGWPLAAGAVALQLLCGAPEIIVLTWTGLGILTLLQVRRGESVARAGILLRAGAILLAGAAMAAAQLLPFLELLRHSQRSASYDSSAWSLAWTGLGNFVVPLFHTVRDRDGIFFQPNQQWISSIYSGVVVLLLSLYALFGRRDRKTKLILLAIVMSLWLALGREGGLYAGLRAALPFLGIMRYPIKLIVPVLFLLPLLAGIGAEKWLRQPADARRIWICAGIIGGLTLAILGLAQFHPGPGENLGATWRSGFFRLGFLLAAALLLAHPRIARAGKFGFWLILGLVYVDQFQALRGINPVVESRAMTEPVADLQPRPVLGERRALVTAVTAEHFDGALLPDPTLSVIVPRRALVLNANLVERIPKLAGFFSLYFPEFGGVAFKLLKEPFDPLHGPLLDFLGISHVSRPDGGWIFRSTALPMLTLVPETRLVPAAEIVHRLFSKEFDPRHFAFLPEETGVRLNGQGTGTILSASFRANAIDGQVSVQNAPMLLVLAQNDYPGWKAYLNGRSVPILRANRFFQAIEVPRGRSQISFRFESGTFRAGFCVSLLVLGVVLILAFRQWKGRPAG